MKEWKHQKSKKEIWYSPLVLLFLLFIIIVFMYNMVNLIEKTRETEKKKELVENRIKELQERQSTLQNELQKMKTEDGVEEILRDKYQLVKEGEKMVVLVDEDNKDDFGNNKPKNNSFIKFLQNLFK